MPVVDDATIGRIFREESGRSVATLIRIFGDIDVAEDAVQEAFALALRKWPVDGLPPNPGGWITTTARNRAIDHLRREARGRELMGQAIRGAEEPSGEEAEPVQDDRLRLIFTCCHPALSTEAQVALTLRLLGGLTTEQVARAFLVAEPTMAKRLVRAKHKIKAAHIPYRVPSEAELPERLRPVLAVLYLIYNAGTSGPSGDELRQEAIRLARAVASLMPDEAEVAGLLALLLLTESRWPARFSADGSLVLLRDQDRSAWDRAMISEGQGIVRACLRRNQPGPYQIQAAINAVHADAQAIEATDWGQIAALYDRLFAVSPNPVVALNRAIAVGEVRGPAAALALIDGLDLDDYHLFHAARADLLRRLGRPTDAAQAYGRAAVLATSDAERAFIEGRLAALGPIGHDEVPAASRAWDQGGYPRVMDSPSTDVIPLLACSDIEAEHDFLVGVLGLASAGLERMPDGTVVHGEVRAGSRRVWLHRADEAQRLVPPGPRGPAGGGIVIHVPDVDAHHQRVRAAGADILSEPGDEDYGQREYGVRDPEGHLWWIATPTQPPAAR